MLTTKVHRFRYSKAVRHEHEPIVQDGLAVTPSMMEEMAMLGKPISTSTLGAEYFDNTARNDFGVDPQFQRGACIVEVWETEQDARAKFKKAVEYDATHASAQELG